ncbi:MAG TPA: hypothetical protein VGL19_04845, partial [Polyangiaceae bacterium]
MPSSQTGKPASVAPVRGSWLNSTRLVLLASAFGAVLLSAVALLFVAPQLFARLRSQPPAKVEPVDPVDAARARLAEYEARRRTATDFAHVPPANLTHGADPYALARLDSQHLVGILRGASALVLLDTELHELQRIELPGSAVAVAVTSAHECWVAGEASRGLAQFLFDGQKLRRGATLELPEFVGIVALTGGPRGVLYALDAHDGHLLTVRPAAAPAHVLESRSVGHGPLSLRRVGSLLIVDLLLDHALVVYRLGADGQIIEERARIHHDGPIWGFDAAALPDGSLSLVAAGVEDHPLVRSEEGFGYIDSFVFCYQLSPLGPARELWRLNVSELGVVTPKAPVLSVLGSSATLFVAGYASDRAVELTFDPRSPEPPRSRVEAFTPGTNAAIHLDSGALAFANPL